MSNIISAKCWVLKELSSSEKFVLVSLADQANDSGVCWPSVGSISLRTALTDRTVQKAMKSLIERGLLTRNERRGRSTVYNVTVDDYLEKQRQAELLEEEQTPEAGSPPKQVHPEGDSPQPPKDVHPTPEAGTPHPRNLDGENHNRTVREPSVEPPSGASSCATEKSDPDSKPEYRTAKGKSLTGDNLENFLAFWKTFAYPKDKARAADAWLKIPWARRGDPNAQASNRKLVNQILRAAAVEASQRPAKLQANLTPIYAEGWLTARRWEDEVPDMRAAQQNRLSGPSEVQTDRQKVRAALQNITDTDWGNPNAPQQQGRVYDHEPN